MGENPVACPTSGLALDSDCILNWRNRHYLVRCRSLTRNPEAAGLDDARRLDAATLHEVFGDIVPSISLSVSPRKRSPHLLAGD